MGNFLSFYQPPTTLLMIPKIKLLEKKRKKMLRDIILLYIHVYHKWISYDIWLLIYEVQQTDIFIILGYFLPFQPLDNLENQNSNIEKNTWRYYYFTHLHHKWQYNHMMVPEIWSMTVIIFCLSRPFFPFYPPNNLKIKILKKWKNHL